MNGQNGQSVGDAVFSSLGKGVSVRGHQGEDAEDGAGVIELRAGLDINSALVKKEFSSSNGSAAAAELAIKADRSGKMLHQQGGAPIDDAGVPVIGSHPVGGIGGAAGFKADGKGSGLVLRLPVERVVVAAMAEVKETSSGGEEIEGSFRVSARALEDAASLARPLFGFFQVEQDSKPNRQVIVAKSAGAIFEIGFEVKDGVAEFGVPGARDFPQFLGDGRSTRLAPDPGR